MKFLITGACGFIGSSLCHSLLSSGHQVIGVDDLSNGYLERLDGCIENMRFIKCPVAILADVLFEKVDVVLHFAALAPLKDNQVHWYRSLEKNVASVGGILDYCRVNNVSKLIFASSNAIYERTKQSPATETSAVNPLLAYPVGKVLAERVLEAFASTHSGISITSLRLANAYGPRQDYFREMPPLIGYLIRGAIKDEPLKLYGDGEQAREYLFIDDLVRLIEIISIRTSFAEGYEVLNVGGGGVYSVNQLVDRVEALFSKSLIISRGEPSSFWGTELFTGSVGLHDSFVSDEVNKMTKISSDLAMSIYGWEHETSMDRGLKACVDYATTYFESRL